MDTPQSEETFSPINIDFDKERTVIAMTKAGHSANALTTTYFSVMPSADNIWEAFFSDGMPAMLHNARKATIYSNHIECKCTLDDVNELLKDFRAKASYANDRYKEHLATLEHQKKVKEDEENARQTAIENKIDQLGLDE